MSDAARPSGSSVGSSADGGSIQTECLDCGHTDTAGAHETVPACGEVVHYVGCPECGSPRWGGNEVREIVAVTSPEVDQ